MNRKTKRALRKFQRSAWAWGLALPAYFWVLPGGSYGWQEWASLGYSYAVSDFMLNIAAPAGALGIVVLAAMQLTRSWFAYQVADLANIRPERIRAR